MTVMPETEAPEPADPDEGDWLGPSWMWVPGDLDANHPDTDHR